MMTIEQGHYVIEFLGHEGQTLISHVVTGSYHKAQFEAAQMTKAIGTEHYRIMRCMMTSHDKDRWEVKSKSMMG